MKFFVDFQFLEKDKLSVIDKATTWEVPIYECEFELVVTGNIAGSLQTKARTKSYGPTDKNDKFDGLLCNNGRKFCLLLDSSRLRHELIAHEIFHATHRIMEYCGDKFSENHHEPYAYLCGHLTQVIYNRLSRWRVKVR